MNLMNMVIGIVGAAMATSGLVPGPLDGLKQRRVGQQHVQRREIGRQLAHLDRQPEIEHAGAVTTSIVSDDPVAASPRIAAVESRAPAPPSVPGSSSSAGAAASACQETVGSTGGARCCCSCEARAPATAPFTRGCRANRGSIRGVVKDVGMPQNYLACDREQPFLLPPDVRGSAPPRTLRGSLTR
jgi:hypothetical protein